MFIWSVIAILFSVTSILVIFVNMFKQSRDENARNAEAEKKRLEKEKEKANAAGKWGISMPNFYLHEARLCYMKLLFTKIRFQLSVSAEISRARQPLNGSPSAFLIVHTAFSMLNSALNEL
jgi:hypothetical protein